jgi:4-amino-4-deoxy-L-arabinose transferase-like glycosyltransferase
VDVVVTQAESDAVLKGLTGTWPAELGERPALWLPASALLFWLVPRWRRDWSARRGETWLLLFWVLAVLVFFSLSPGKRGVYILPALPALVLAASAHLDELLIDTTEFCAAAANQLCIDIHLAHVIDDDGHA